MWKDIQKDSKEKLLGRLQSLLPSQSFLIFDLDGSLNGLNAMGYDWKKDEKLRESILRKIEGWYGDGVKITKTAAENLPALVYCLGEGRLEWNEFRKESKQALMTGMEAYFKGEDIDEKKVSNMIYGYARGRVLWLSR